MSMSVSVLTSWLGPLLRGWVPASTVVTSLVHTFLPIASSSFRFSLSISLCRRRHRTSSYSQVRTRGYLRCTWLFLVPPSVVAWISWVIQKQSSPVPTSIYAACSSLLLGYTIIYYHVSPFHPLARYPDPFLARVSKLFMVGVVIKGHAHRYCRRLHEKHGDIQVSTFNTCLPYQ